MLCKYQKKYQANDEQKSNDGTKFWQWLPPRLFSERCFTILPNQMTSNGFKILNQARFYLYTISVHRVRSSGFSVFIFSFFCVILGRKFGLTFKFIAFVSGFQAEQNSCTPKKIKLNEKDRSRSWTIFIEHLNVCLEAKWPTAHIGRFWVPFKSF